MFFENQNFCKKNKIRIYYKMTTSRPFYLSDLDIIADASQALMAGIDTTVFTADATAEFDVPLTFLRQLFQYHSDASDVDNVDADDTLYKVSYATSSTQITSNFITNTIVTSNKQDANAPLQDLARDYVRYLAYKLFNTPQGVDLFDNETELRTNLNLECRNKMHAKLLDLADHGILDAASSNPNPALKLLKQIIKQAPGRLSGGDPANTADPWHIVSGTVAGENAWYEMPLVVGDSICFKLKVVADPGQNSIIAIAVSNPADWTYLIKMNAI
jgi:hypothetical protein